jgi:hypothetical protein
VYAEPRIRSISDKDRFDDAEIVEDFERTRLDALAPRACEGCFRNLDQAAMDFPAYKVEGPAPAIQYRYSHFVHGTK